MRKKMRLTTCLVCFLSLFFLAPAALAIGQVTEPIVNNNALRGQSFQAELMIVNTDNKEVRIGFTAEGKIANWVKFYLPADLKNSINETTVASKVNLNVVAVFSVPSDAPNGEYAGTVSVITKPEGVSKKDESSSIVSQKIDREVKITVNDKEVVKFDASVIPEKYDLKKDEPLKIRIIYDNQGNISLSPQIELKIKKDEQIIYNVIYPYPENEPAVQSNSLHEIPALTIPTAGFADGQYATELKFLQGGKPALEKSFSFSIGNPEVLGVFAKLKGIELNISWWIISLILLLMATITGTILLRKLSRK